MLRKALSRIAQELASCLIVDKFVLLGVVRIKKKNVAFLNSILLYTIR
jgi:hypothetical protein